MTALDRDLIEHAQQAAPEPDAEAVFSLRAWARAYLFQVGELHEAVDVLQASTEQSGLVGRIGQDAVQQILADAFAVVRAALDPDPVDYAGQLSDAECGVAKTSIDVAVYLTRTNKAKRLEAWLCDTR